MKQKLTSTIVFKELLFLALILLTPLISANTFGYNYLDNQQTIIEGANYSINVNNTEHLQGRDTSSLYTYFQSLFNSVYYSISNPFGFYNSTTLDLTSYALLNGSNQPFTGNLNVNKANPTIKLTDTGNNEYATWTKNDTNNLVSHKARTQGLALDYGNIALGKAYTWIVGGGGSYPDTGNTEMTNGVLPSTAVYTNSAWTGLQNSNPTLRFDFGSPATFNRVKIYYLIQASVTAFAPSSILIEGSEDNVAWNTLGNFAQSGNWTEGVDGRYYTNDLNVTGKHRYVRITISRWQASCWTFIGEIEIYNDNATFMEENTYITAQDGESAGEYFKLGLGHATGRTTIDGLTTRFNNQGVEQFQIDTSGDLVFPDAQYTYFGTGKDSLIGYDGTNMLLNPRAVGSGNVIIGPTSTGVKATQGGLDIASGGNALVIGADNNALTRTDATLKAARIGGYHYTNAERPFAFLLGLSGSTNNQLDIGGGSSAFNAATLIRFLTASNTTTTTGTERMRITSDGNVSIGTTSPTEKLDVLGNVKINGTLITNSMKSLTGENITFFNSTLTGYANLNAKSFNVFSPEDKAYVQDYLTKVPEPSKILSLDGKLARTFMFENERKDNTPVEDLTKPIYQNVTTQECNEVEDKPQELLDGEIVKEATTRTECKDVVTQIKVGYETKLENATDIGAMGFNNRLILSELKEQVSQFINRLTGAEAKITNLEAQVESLNIRLAKLEGVKI